MKTILIVLALSVVTASAQDRSPEQVRWGKTYAWSTAAIAGATVADMASSFKFTHDGQREANGLLASNGGYGAKGAAIQLGVTAGSLLVQSMLIRRHPWLRAPFAVANYGMAGFQVYNVRHNLNYGGVR